MTVLVIEGPEYGKLESHNKFSSFITTGSIIPDDLIYEWYRNGKIIEQDISESPQSLMLWDVDYPAEGEIKLVTKSVLDPEFNLQSNDISFKIDEAITPDVCPFIYSNPLPVRTSVYIWMGWWVIDEIMKAKEDGFNWLKTPMDKRFIYKCDLAKIAELINTYDHVEVQESRNGYILTKSFLM